MKPVNELFPNPLLVNLSQPIFPWLRRLVVRQKVASSDVDDVVQEVCIRIWQKSRLVREAHTPVAYVTMIVKEVVRVYRQRTHRWEEALAAQRERESRAGGPTPEQHAFIRECCAIVDDFIQQIDETARPIFIEREVDGDSIAEIAARHGLTERRVKKLLSAARRDFEAAMDRWEAKDRRRGGGRLRGFMVPFWLSDLRLWLRSLLLRLVARQVVASTAILLAAVLCPSDLHHPEASSPFQAAAHLALPGFAPSSPVGIGEGAGVGPAGVTASDPELAEGGVKTPAGHAGASPSNARIHDAPELEEKLIGGARAALLLGTPEGRARARQLLEMHRDRVPEGHLAIEREALFTQLRRADSGRLL